MPPPSNERKAVLDFIDGGGSLAEAKTLLETFLAKNPEIAEKEHVQHALRHIDALIEYSTISGLPITVELKSRLRRVLQDET